MCVGVESAPTYACKILRNRIYAYPALFPCSTTTSLQLACVYTHTHTQSGCVCVCAYPPKETHLPTFRT